MADFHPQARVNLEKAVVLLLDDKADSMNVLVQIVTAFGVRNMHRCHAVEDAQELAKSTELDLILTNANLNSAPGYEFISWLRRSKLEPNAFTPAILITGHTKRSNVQKARDCGANFVLAKPVSPAVMLERIIWIASEKRPFVNCASYVGPDRRFHELGPPEGAVGRRHDDLPDIVAPVEPETVSGDTMNEPARASL
jgi:CheY-like chemotaxis protein